MQIHPPRCRPTPLGRRDIHAPSSFTVINRTPITHNHPATMAPLRRYLRITPSSVLELREENERVKARGRGVKDVVSGDGFEVSVFLTQTSTRHTVLKRRKIFREPERKGDDTNPDSPAPLPREESDDVVIQDVPPAPSTAESTNHPPPTRHSKRTRPAEDADTLVVADSNASDASASDSDADAPPTKRARSAAPLGGAEEEEQDEKKMAMRSEYDGYGIYGRVLCLIVTKTAVKDAGGGREVMEEWIASTQNPAGEAT
ncbi:hypothetical protein VC83_03393 [Pseudogymnoascus destructans]|uniref:Uncharacterized protein n=1 Tax=Pseudogymnoascus destructans TaxID=655981 RepID=A0A177AFQ3_9PEZI|nr:uncharacterized protein VC83_03393 [Pseudogymnoascus destructans]OAF60660.2 hypothetical protein VC83_03393 [Pseudogymnoascus destructans]